MKLLRLLAVVAALVVMTSGFAPAQGVGSSGSITGTVSDPTGAVIANATVTVSDMEKGIRRTAPTNARGEFVVPGLSPASYEVRAEKPGFETELHKSVVVNIGKTVTLDFQLKVSSAKEVVEVTTEPPVVDTQRGSQADVIGQEYIQDLPIDRRDYLTFALLDPAVNDARRINGADLRVRQTPQSGLSVYGSNGRGNNVTVDGGEFNGDSGGVLTNLGQDAVQEFQINRTNYTAELGAGSGASINIVSKTGTNNVHGSIYAFFRNDAFDAANPYAGTNALQPGQLTAATGFSLNAQSQHVKNSLNRQQFGGTIGFPIKRDKTFMFLSAEGLHERKQVAVPLLTDSSIFAPNAGQNAILAGLLAQPNTNVPCITGGFAIPSAVCAGILKNALTISGDTGIVPPSPTYPGQTVLNKFLLNMFETNGGLFQAPNTSAFYSGRLDHTFNDHDQMYLRYLYGRADDGNPDVSGLLGISGGSQVRTWTSSLLASWFHQFSPKTQNEARLQWNLVQFNDFANDPGGPAFSISGFGAFGRDVTLPDFSTLRQYEFADNLTAIRGRHTMKMGFYEDLRGNRTASATFLGDNFTFTALPGGIFFPCLQVPIVCATSSTSTLNNARAAQLTSLQAFSLGVPAFFQAGFGNPTTVSDLPLTAVFWQDSWQMSSSLTVNYGVRYELDTRWVMPTDDLNFAPRVSFAWDPFKDHKTVFRGGAGIFYSPTYIQIDYATKELGFVNGAPPQIQNFLVPLNVSPLPPVIFGTLFNQGKLGGCGLNGGPSGAGVGGCIKPADLTQFGALSGFPAFFNVPKVFHNPYSEQLSFGVERQLGNDMSVAASYIYVHTLRLPRTVDTNLLPTAPTVVNPLGGLPFKSWSSQNAPQCALLVNNPCFANPLVLENNQYQSNASALYQGGTLELKKRFSRHYTMMANYTYSKATDDNTDFNLSYVPANEANFALDHGPSAFDQRHKITVAGIVESPWKNPVLAHFQLAPVVQYNSGQPFNVLAGFDVNGDTHSNDRPIGVGRNSGTPVNYFNVDTRLSRQFKVGERTGVQFMAEAFNLFNRTNYSSLNNNCAADRTLAGAQTCVFTPTVYPADASGHFAGSNQGLVGTSGPFAFNDVVGHQKRVFQFGARVSF